MSASNSGHSNSEHRVGKYAGKDNPNSRDDHPIRSENIFFSQRYGASWEELPYWEGLLDFNGCGLVSLTMCIDIVTGRNFTPEDVYNMRKHYGIDQSRIASRDGKCVCGGDVQFQFNPMNRKLFGIESCLLERNLSAFKRALAKDNTVIWASSRNTDFYDKRGNSRWIYGGHVLCIWKFEEGDFWIKDPGLPKELGNNVLYSEKMMQEWISGWEYQQFEVRKYSE